MSTRDVLQSLLANELDSLQAYAERLCHVFNQIFPTQPDHEIPRLIRTLNIYGHQTSHEIVNVKTIDLTENLSSEEVLQALESQISLLCQTLKLFLNFQVDPFVIGEKIIRLINSSYDLVYEFHTTYDPTSKVTIQLPRMEFLQSKNAIKERQIPHFFLSFQTLGPLLEDYAPIYSLDQTRMNRSKELIQLGNEHIFRKSYDKALKSFQKSFDYYPSAKAKNLIGWSYYLLENLDQAKESCLEALSMDPELGDPYNDLGSYLLSEGKVEESHVWFERAKKAPKYLNREFPYINCGKAFLLQKKYLEALREFEMASEYAPLNKQIKMTIKKLRTLLSMDDQQAPVTNEELLSPLN